MPKWKGSYFRQLAQCTLVFDKFESLFGVVYVLFVGCSDFIRCPEARHERMVLLRPLPAKSNSAARYTYIYIHTHPYIYVGEHFTHSSDSNFQNNSCTAPRQELGSGSTNSTTSPGRHGEMSFFPVVLSFGCCSHRNREEKGRQQGRFVPYEATNPRTCKHWYTVRDHHCVAGRGQDKAGRLALADPRWTRVCYTEITCCLALS